MNVKNHFTVGYRLNRQRHLVLGVTSIVPNLNGVLMFTEDGKNHFIESWQLRHELLTGMFISYDPEDEEVFVDDEVVHDHRRKEE